MGERRVERGDIGGKPTVPGGKMWLQAHLPGPVLARVGVEKTYFRWMGQCLEVVYKFEGGASLAGT